MTSRERVLTALAREQPDHVPVDYSANAGIDHRLKSYFGLAMDDHEGLLQKLGVDFRGVYPQYIGPKLHADIPERGVHVDDWGIHRVWVEHPSGGYWDYCDFPLQYATEDEIAAWPLPSPDNYDYSSIADSCKKLGSLALYIGGAGIADIINCNGMLRTMEQTLVDLVTDEPAGLLLARRRLNIQLETLRRTLEAAQGRVDFIMMGEDLGTQRGPIISLELYRRCIRPLHQQVVDLAKCYGIPVMVHTCGSSSWVYEDFIAMGVTAVDTLQPEAVNMSPAYLKQTFGGRLAFHGCISTAGPVAYGTVADVVADCHKTLEIMKPGGGYCFAPTHSLQDNSPTENVIAMYDTARQYG